jgi:hypothetical protein
MGQMGRQFLAKSLFTTLCPPSPNTHIKIPPTSDRQC